MRRLPTTTANGKGMPEPARLAAVSVPIMANSPMATLTMRVVVYVTTRPRPSRA